MARLLALLPLVVLSATAQPGASPLQLAHAHNDYEHERPLLDALAQRFHSVEADVWLADGRILVSHNHGNWKGSLKNLYLDPLQQRVSNTGSVLPDKLPFLLWIDLKPNGKEILPALHQLLAQYPMLTVFTGKTTRPGPVTVVLTGNADAKTAYVQTYGTRYACRDSNSFRETDPTADNRWSWYALKWSSCVDWNGKDPMPADQEQRLRKLVDAIHAKGRRVRFYATPETRLYWQKAQETGIDLINTDRLRDLHDFLARPEAH
jgi:hypothetical protein